ncbi:unnamed protein product, partial [Clonostachys rosea]
LDILGRLPSGPQLQKSKRTEGEIERMASRKNQLDADPISPKPSARKINTACLQCRERKVRCSGSCPCTNCVRRSAECVFEQEERKVLVSEKHVHARP